MFFPEELAENEIFVFGSNLAGAHGGGAARLACERFGAVWGQGVGLQGKCYAIPTMQGGVETIKPYVDQFIDFAKEHSELFFYVTRIGCGIAGFKDSDIAPLFQEAMGVENICLPKEFVQENGKNVAKPSWNAEKDFLEEYRVLMNKVRDGDMCAYSHIKELRAKEFQNTISLVNQGYFVLDSGEKYFLPDDSKMMHNTIFYENEIQTLQAPQASQHTIVKVENKDCLYAGVQLKSRGYNPAVLNMASRSNPGGGVLTGAGAQEETLFRRTNLFRSLYQFASYASEYGIKRHDNQYPLNRNFGGIYTPTAIYFRESEQNGYKLLGNPITLSFITVAAINRPDLASNEMIASNHIEPTKNKIRTILRIGLVNGHDSLVLGAFGCGAFCNPPRHMAKLFHEVLREGEFANKYRLILFAILDDHNAHKSHNPEGNFKPFAEEFATF